MNRLLVFLLAAFDALVAVAVGIAACLAPLTVMFIFGFGDGAAWSALWPAAARVWQVGHLVPVSVSLPPEYLTAAGVATDAASFTVSLAPLAFAAFTAIFAARSGARAAAAGAWPTGVAAGGAVFAAASSLILLTSGNDVAAVEPWQAVVLPTAVFVVPGLVGALVGAWTDGDDGVIDAVRRRLPAEWVAVPGLVVRGAGIAIAGMVAAAGILLAVSIALNGARIVALYEAAHLDVTGATLVTLGELGYLPTVLVWSFAFVAGPGFAVGSGTAVSGAGTAVGALPAIPLFGAIPESSSPWLLLLALIPVALGAGAGWVARVRLAADGRSETGPRVVIAVVIAAVTGGVAALLAVTASGSLGPGRLTEIGPDAGQVAVAVGLEVLLGAAIVLLSPVRTVHEKDGERR